MIGHLLPVEWALVLIPLFLWVVVPLVVLSRLGRIVRLLEEIAQKVDRAGKRGD